MDSTAVDLAIATSNVKPFNNHLMAFRISTPNGPEWITMDSSKKIPYCVVRESDAVIDIRNRVVLRGPTRIWELNTKHQTVNDFITSLIQQRIVGPTQATLLVQLC